MRKSSHRQQHRPDSGSDKLPVIAYPLSEPITSVHRLLRHYSQETAPTSPTHCVAQHFSQDRNKPVRSSDIRGHWRLSESVLYIVCYYRWCPGEVRGHDGQTSLRLIILDFGILILIHLSLQMRSWLLRLSERLARASPLFSILF